MKNTAFYLTLCLLLTLSNVSSAQDAGNYLYNNPYQVPDKMRVALNTPAGSNISLKAEVMMNVKATSYTAIFAMTQTGRDAYEVDSLMQGRLNQVRFALALLGIADSDIHIDAVSMVPTYAYKLEEKKFSKRSIEVPTGLEMKKNVHILFRNHDVLDRIISEMAFVDVYDLVKVEYNIDGVQTYFEELRKAALSVIETKKSTYSSLQLHLDIYSMADGFQCVYPMERYKSYTAFYSGSSPHAVSHALGIRENNISVIGKNNTIKVDGSLTADAFNQQFIIQTAEKNKTIFYDRMPYNQFDKVINADVEEPSIQLYYTLEVYYTMITEEQFKTRQEQLELSKKQQLANQEPRRRRGRK
jgi:uncharacterized protein YggE